MTPLSDRQARILLYIVEHCVECGMPPTTRDIGLELRISRSNAQYNIGQLVRKGYLQTKEGPVQSRSLCVVGYQAAIQDAGQSYLADLKTNLSALTITPKRESTHAA